MTRNDVLTQAFEQCMKEIYSYVQPKVTWNDFVQENKQYNKLYKQWESYRNAYINKDENSKVWEEWNLIHPEWLDKSPDDCIGPKPFEFYYLPKEILKEICDNYIYAYRLDEQQELLDIIEVLKKYCREPIVDKYVEAYTDETGYHPGYKDYEHSFNLQLTIYRQSRDMFPKGDWKQFEEISKMSQNKFFEFLDMAGDFFNWNRDLNSFNMSVYLGPSPNSNKQRVIENWKKYRNKDIEIDDEQIKKEYYGDNE